MRAGQSPKRWRNRITGERYTRERTADDHIWLCSDKTGETIYVHKREIHERYVPVHVERSFYDRKKRVAL